jgi:invasion protein IalB
MESDRLVTARPYRQARAAGSVLTGAVFLATVVGQVQAQQPPAKEQPPKAAPAKPKAAQPKTPAAQSKEATAAPPPSQAAAPPTQPPQFTYSPWTKFCTPDAQAKQVCITAKDGRLEDGRVAVSAALIEPEGEQRKILKVMVLPLGLQISLGTRVAVDQGQPMSGPYATCFPNACFADYEASAELVDRMKQGQTLIVQAISVNNQVISLPVPLKDFAKAYDGPPLDAKTFDELQKKLQAELERKAREFEQKAAPPAVRTE